MENEPNKPLMEHPAYVAGELASLRCLILGLIDATGTDRRTVANHALQHLETERNAFLHSQLPEQYEVAVTHFDQWIRHALL